MNIDIIVNQASLHIRNVIEKMNQTFLLQESNFCISQSVTDTYNWVNGMGNCLIVWCNRLIRPIYKNDHNS
jgi:hypothetical protein